MTEQELREQIMLSAFEDELEKLSAIAFTRAGHDYYAREGKAREKYHTKMRRASQQYNAEQPLFASMEPTIHRMGARSAAYQKRKHRKGKQGWNPFGGLLTPTKAEKLEKLERTKRTAKMRKKKSKK